MHTFFFPPKHYCFFFTFIIIAGSSIAQVGGIINAYTPVMSFGLCNRLQVEDAAAFHSGDTVLLIQMKGAVIDSSDSPSFGFITDYQNAGNYEINYVKTTSGNTVQLKNKLTRQYDAPNGRVQLVRIPYYKSAIISSTLTCLPWDGRKGGILVINAKDTIDMHADMDVTGKGFRGGNTYNIGPAVLSCYRAGYYYDSSSQESGRKGEGVAELGADKLNGRGRQANGGGGGNGHNAGGGGGGNGAFGGLGGYQLLECGSGTYDNRGQGGVQLGNNFFVNKAFLGGGGGSGHKDGLPTIDVSSAGGNGGGLVIVIAAYLKSNGFSIIANGAAGRQCDVEGFNCLHDGMGGGGAGGSVMLSVNNYLDVSKSIVKGGKGADLSIYFPAAGHVGPGGGGSGGTVFFKGGMPVPAMITMQVPGGAKGVIVPDGNNSFGTLDGFAGSPINGLQLSVDSVLFADTCTTTPVSITLFNAAADHKNIKLSWRTEEESGIVSYIVQRSLNPVSGFKNIGAVNAVNTFNSNDYSFYDNDVMSNTVYFYRLQINENTGVKKYSAIQKIKLTNRGFEFSAFPNPANDLLNIRLGDLSGSAKISLLNNLGQVLLTRQLNTALNREAVFDISRQPAGNYWVTVQTDFGIQYKKILKL